MHRLRIAGALLAILYHPAFGQPVHPLINEFVVNHAGIDRNEYIEVVGRPDFDYAAFVVLEVEGDAGTTLGVIDGVYPVGTTDMNGYWTTGFLNSAIENGTVTFLLVKGFTGRAGMDLDDDDDGTLDPPAPWNRLVDAVAVTDGGDGDRAYTDVVLSAAFDDQHTTPGGASRLPDGTDTDTVGDWLRNDFDGDGLPLFPDAPHASSGEAVNTPGSANRPGFTLPPPSPPPGLIINEIDADTPGSDTREFIELYDGGIGHTALDDLVIVLYNGQTDRSYQRLDLDGYATDTDGFFVLGGPEVTPAADLLLPPNALQNGADAVALYAGDADDFPNGTPVTTTYLVDAVVYDTDDADDAGLLTLLLPGQPQINEKASGNSAEVSIQRLPNGAGGTRRTASYVPFRPSPGSLNGGADLSLRQSVVVSNHDSAARSFTLTLLLANDGPAHATGVEVTDHLPEGMTVVRATTSQGRFDPISNVWTVGDLARDDAALLYLTVTTDQPHPASNTAEVTAVRQPDPDSVPGDHQGDDFAATSFDHALPDLDRYQADLRLSMTAMPAQAYVGETITFTLTVTNDGPVTTAGVAVAGRLPDALSFVSASGDGRYDPASGRWDVGHLPAASSENLTVTANVSGGDTLVFSAEIIRSTLPDPDSFVDNAVPGEDDRAFAIVHVRTMTTQATGITANAPPEHLAWGPAYPNPFHNRLTIPLMLPTATHVTVTLYDVLGRTVATLVDQSMPAGKHFVLWDAPHCQSGTYLASLKAGHETKITFITLMK